ncbi:MAG: hypothetical protein ACP5FK_00730 [bacterium]
MKYSVLLLIVVIGFLVSCNSSNPNNPQPQGISEGTWRGVTSTGDSITFMVEQSHVDSFNIVLIYRFQSLTDTVSWHLPRTEIVTNSITINDSIAGNPSYNVEVTGNFTPPNSIAGMVDTDGRYHPDSSSTELVNYSVSWEASH